MNSVCVDAIKQPTTKSHLRKKKVYFSLQVQRDGVHDVWEGMASCQKKHSDRNWKLADQIFIHTGSGGQP